MITLELQQIEARHGRVGERHLSGFPIQAPRVSRREVSAEFLPDVLRLAGDDAVREIFVFFRAKRRVAAPGDDERALSLVEREQLLLPLRLYPHSTHADDVRACRRGNGLDVLVDDLDLPALRAEGRECRQAERRADRGLVGEDPIDRPAKAPKAVGKLRVHQQKLHGGRICRRAVKVNSTAP